VKALTQSSLANRILGAIFMIIFSSMCQDKIDLRIFFDKRFPEMRFIPRIVSRMDQNREIFYILYYFKNPGLYLARVNQVSIFQAGWGGSIKDQIVNSFLAFHLPVNGTPFWFVNAPYLGIMARLLFTVGIAVAFWRIRQLAYRLLLF